MLISMPTATSATLGARQAQAYMLISMPTLTSATLGAFQAMLSSDERRLSRTASAIVKVKPTPDQQISISWIGNPNGGENGQCAGCAAPPEGILTRHRPSGDGFFIAVFSRQ